MVPRAAVLLSALLLTGPPAWAQILRGAVLDSTSRRPVVGSRVTALDASGATSAYAVTDSTGQFVFRLPAVGAYRLRAARFGYTTRLTESIILDSAFAASVTVLLTPSAVPLDTLTVIAEKMAVERQIPWLAEDGFYDRRRKGFGYFLTRSDIATRDPARMTNALRGLSGVGVVCSGRRMPVTCDAFMPGALTMFLGKVCLPSVVLDGVVVRVGGSSGGSSIDELLNPFNMEAIEVYTSPAGIPPQWGGYISPCGAIVAWSRR